ncbi:SAF domain-containing protein, partial [Salmonella enterica subsp. enterica serovar Kentucky]|nr:SAF domain-containing protein [Salmonella enterica subsp. enterica serovar Kentucky]
QGHKVALTNIPAHGEIIRYGEVIGYAVRDIPRGSWIDESLVEHLSAQYGYTTRQYHHLPDISMRKKAQAEAKNSISVLSFFIL